VVTIVLRLRVPAPGNWQGAKCHIVEVNRDYDPWFLEEDATVEERAAAEQEAKTFCNGDIDGDVCQIRHECLIFSLTNNEKFGVWGGTNPLTRKAIRRQWPLRSGKVPRPEWHFMTEQEALALHAPATQAELIVGPDDEDGEEEEWPG
jgi:hypothetical protein